MDTKVINIDRKDIDKEALKEAAKIIRGGGLVAFPTETVYGLGADAFNKDAAKKIYGAKKRPSDNPLIVHIADFCELDKIVGEVSEDARRLMDRFWPGPMTLIFKKKEGIPSQTTAGLDTVAVRMPEDELAREFIRLCKTPIAAPSANLSGSPSPTSAEHVYKDMKGRIDMLIASDDSKVGLESTIVDVSVSIPLVLRPGAITLNMLREVNENISIDPAILKKPEKDLLPKAPGMKYRHYAPKAKLVIVEGDFDKFKSFVEKEKDLAAGKKIGLILTEENKGKIEADEVEYVGSRLSYEDIAHNLFAVLRRFDEKNIDIIYSESFDESELGMAIMNRLVKAAGYNIIKL